MQHIHFVYAPPKSDKWEDEESLVFRHGNEDECVHTQTNVMQHLKSELHCKKMIISKNDIQVSKVVGQGNFSTPNNSHNFHTTMLTSVLQESQDWCTVVTLTLEVGEIW